MDVIDLKMPRLGETMESGHLVRWLKAPGDRIVRGEILLELETDKTIAELPSMFDGRMLEHLARAGEDVVVDTVIARLEVESTQGTPSQPSSPNPYTANADLSTSTVNSQSKSQFGTTENANALGPPDSSLTFASPSVRQLAYELGVEPACVLATGLKGRILKDDIYLQSRNSMPASFDTARGASVRNQGISPEPMSQPRIDFSKFGDVEMQALPRIRKISAQNLARNWVMIPAVTYHEDADITDLEAFRVAINRENDDAGAKITLLAFVIKASQLALKKFPEFNSSLDLENEEMRLVLKKYFHIAFAADTPHGLQVPVIKDVDQKSVSQIAVECDELARKARDGKLGPTDVAGAGFTISSLGGIGGTSFSPIVNAPEVAILGLSRAVMRPVWNGREFVPRLVLPLSLSADHRVIDGAQGTRFNAYLAKLLGDMRRALL